MLCKAYKKMFTVNVMPLAYGPLYLVSLSLVQVLDSVDDPNKQKLALSRVSR